MVNSKKKRTVSLKVNYITVFVKQDPFGKPQLLFF